MIVDWAHMKEMFDGLRETTRKKVVWEEVDHTVTMYKVGTNLIRIDIKEEKNEKDLSNS